MTTRDKIASRAHDMYIRLGIRSVSMDDVCRELGMSKKTLYKEFENKEDLLIAALSTRLEDDMIICTACRAEASDSIDEMFRLTSYILKQLRALSPSAIHDLRKYYPKQWEMMNDFHHDFVRGMVRENLELGIEQGLYRDDLNVDIISRFYVLKAMIIVDETYFPLDEYRRDLLFQEHIMLHMHGIVSKDGRERLHEFKEQFSS